jgi:23S rRNA (pseudouridine1915-N3)-methyltransferase
LKIYGATASKSTSTLFRPYMKITLITVGKLKAKGGFRELDSFYRERLRPFCKFEVIELKERNDIDAETDSLKKALPQGSFVVALREEGCSMNSALFSKMLSDNNEKYGHICFVIGGAYGYGNIGENLSVSMAPWTLPHQLARIVLLEQIYRGLSIIKGSGYHHD